MILIFKPTENSGAGTATHANTWWPIDFGIPSSSGAQNNMRYAFFSAADRLMIDANGRQTIYDTADHQISGVSQQQGGNSTVQFVSQKGGVNLSELSIIDGDKTTDPPTIVAIKPENPPTENLPPKELPIENPPKPTIETSADILNTIQQLGDLHAKGILTEKEFQEKKTELLARLWSCLKIRLGNNSFLIPGHIFSPPSLVPSHWPDHSLHLDYQRIDNHI